MMSLNKVTSYNLSRSLKQLHSKEQGTSAVDIQSDRAVAIIREAINTKTLVEKYRSTINLVLQSLENSKGKADLGFRLSTYETDETSRLDDTEIVRYLFHRYRYLEYPLKKIVDDYPPCLQIELTSICNFRCKFCYQSDKSFSSGNSGYMGTMSLADFKRIVDMAAGNIDFVTLASRGEPLLAKDFIEMIDYAKGKFLDLKINTNASMLTEARAHAILASGVKTLVFSVDTTDEEFYREYRVNGDLHKTLNNIRLFGEIRRKHYPESSIITRVSGVLIDPKRQNMDSMVSFWGELVDQVSFVEYSPWEKIYQAQPNDIPDACSDLWRRMFIWHDGTASPCDNDYKVKLKIGSVNSKNISELWRSEKYENLRSTHFEEQRCQLEPCVRCVAF